MMKTSEQNTQTWEKKHWKMMKKGTKNNEQWWPREKKQETLMKKIEKTMKHDEKEKTKKQWKMMKKRETKTMKND